jgi:aryl-phospho-beta-D-glucosidase BglC (GH1 family)
MLAVYMLPSKTVQSAPITSASFLKANGKVLRNNYGNGDVVQLKGTNAGGYMLQEFWMTPTAYSTSPYTVTDEMDIYTTLTARFGEAKMRELVGIYQNNYWTERDFDNCAALGMNVIRLPFWYMNFVDFNGNYLPNAFSRLDWFIQEAGERGIYVILDMHGAPGSQSGSDHSGIDGGNNKEVASQFFFGSNAYNNQQLYYDIWYKIAQRYNGNPTVAGYDLLNEPYCTYRYSSSYSEATLHSTLWNIYNNAYNVIRSVDKDHVIIMEATWEPWDLPNPSTYGWTNVMYEYHNYLYDDYDNANGGQITNMQNKINNIINQGYNVPSYMGEFSYMNNPSAWQQGLKLLNDSGLSWTTWTYKVTGTNNNWGLYNQNVEKVNVATDSEATIRSRWSNVGTSTPNTTLINAVKPYFSTGQTSYPITTIANGEYYLTAVANNKVVCADNTGTSPLIANRDTYGGAWESLTVVNNSDGTISLRSWANNNYVCAVIDQSSQLLARSASISTWEKFTLYKVSSNQYALKSVANGKFVKADLNNNGVLYATSDFVGGAWETFNITPVNVSTNSNVMWFRNFEVAGGITAGANATVASYASTANAGGARSVRLTVSTSGDPSTATRCVNVTPQSGTTINTTGKNHLVFYVNDTQGVNTVKVTIIDSNNALWSGWTSASSVKNQWTKITLPLSSVTGINKAAIKEIRIGEWNAGTYYIDDIYFAVNTTDAVPAF